MNVGRRCSACGAPVTAGQFRLLLAGRGATGLPVYFLVHGDHRDSPNLPPALDVVGAGFTI